MNVHHWTPAQILDMTLPEFWWAVDATAEWQQREADAIRKVTGGGD